MNKEILIRYSELTLKGKNRNHFSKVLFKNIKNKLSNLDYAIERDYDKIIIKPNDNPEDYIKPLSEITGISWYAIVTSVATSKENIEKALDEVFSKNDKATFRVSGKAIDKDLFDSSDSLTRWAAGYILNKYPESKVDLKNYNLNVNIRVLSDGNTQIYCEKHKGIEGLPAGSNGKALQLLSGGIDSPVAAYKTTTRGMNVSFITFLTPVTSTEETVHKIKSIAKRINDFNGVDQKLFIVDFSKIQQRIMMLKKDEYRITLLRRYFVRFSEMISKKYGYDMLITGDSLGQVASQTIESLTMVDNATDMLIARPLISMSKNEIINIATKIKTLELSNLPGDDMCSAFTPDNPIIKPKKEVVLELEAEMTNIDELLNDVIENDIEIVEMKNV